jgi:acyl dehydratase
MTSEPSALKVGDVHSEVVVDDLTRTQIVQYAGASGDYNPLHSDEVFATQVAGFPSIFAHGMLTMGLTGKMVTNYVGDGRLRSFGGRFRAQVWPGDTLTAQAEVVGIRNDDDGVGLVELRITTTNQDGLEVFSGQATATIDQLWPVRST